MPIADVVNLTATPEPSLSTFRAERLLAATNPDGSSSLENLGIEGSPESRLNAERLLAATNPDGSSSLENLGIEGSPESRLNADVTIIEVVILTGERRAF